MTPTQRAAALRLIDNMNLSLETWIEQAENLLRELLAEPVQDRPTTSSQFESVKEAKRVAEYELRYYRKMMEEKNAAEQVQEPVAWGVFVDDELFKPFNCKDEAVDWFQAQYNHGSRYDYLVLPLFAAPQQPMHCPDDGGECGAGGYCRPQQCKPPSDEFVSRVVRSVQPNLDVRCKAWTEQFDECKHWLDAAHNITGEPT